jgi:Co/Zn/Cd efflux system component
MPLSVQELTCDCGPAQMAKGSTKAGGCGCAADQAAELQRRTLWVVLVINAAMFVVELVLGLQAGSTGLIADSLDMLADAGVYGLSLAAVGRSLGEQRQAAVLSGRLQIVLAIWVLLDVLRRTAFGSEPISALMVGIGSLALLANLLCLLLVRRHRQGGVHMRASVIFSTNDTLANLGVIAAGLLVAWSGSRIPDLLIGTAISLLVLQGGRRILREAR